MALTEITKGMSNAAEMINANFGMLNNTASLAENGWFKDEKTGFIIQWGSVSLSSDGSSVSNGITYKTNVVHLPIAFPTKIVSVSASPSDVIGREISLSTDLLSSTLSSFPLTISLLSNAFGSNVYTATYIAMGY